MTVRALVVTGFGINCEEEMAAAYRLAGAEATVAHLNQLFAGRVHLDEFDVLNFPGGFSFGDDLGAGKVLANKVRFRRLSRGGTLLDAIEQFLADGKYILGVCNGFQALVKMGLLPDTLGRLEQEATLCRNDTGKFEDRWCECAVALGKTRSPFLTGITRIRLPVRHGEGKLVLKGDSIRRAVEEQGLACLRYVDAEGAPTQHYPENPNGADLACAGLTDRTGQILGLMPHPEAFLSFYNDPTWPQLRRQRAQASEDGSGLLLFTNIVRHVRTQKARGHSEARSGDQA